jgi:hypothetical protein
MTRFSELIADKLYTAGLFVRATMFYRTTRGAC